MSNAAATSNAPATPWVLWVRTDDETYADGMGERRALLDRFADLTGLALTPRLVAYLEQAPGYWDHGTDAIYFLAPWGGATEWLQADRDTRHAGSGKRD